MTYFNPTAITPLNARAVIDDAYRAAGLNPPTVVDALDEALAKEPTPYDLAVEYATAALDGTRTADEILDEAIARITRSQALHLFRDVYTRTVEQIAHERIDTTRTQAVEDLSPAFGKLVKTIAKHAAKLDTNDPLSRDIAFDTDASTEWRAVTEALTHLSRYVITETPSGHISGSTAQKFALVSIPSVTPQMVERDRIVTRKVTDEHSAHRTTIRDVIKGLESDPDTTLVKIARGDFPDVTLELATPTEHARRIESASNCFVQRRVDERTAAVI